MAASRDDHNIRAELAHRTGAIITRVSNKHIQVTVDRLKRIAHIPEKGRKPAEAGTCPRCESHYRGEEMERNARVCTACGYHFPITARARLDALVDVVEPLGSEILLDVKAGNNTRVALVEPTVRAKVHEQCGSR